MQKSKAVTDSRSWDLKKCLFSVGQWLVSATVEGYGADPSAITWLLDLSWWFPQRLVCACACTKLPMPGKLSSYTGSRFLTFQLGSGSLLLSWDDIPSKSQAQAPYIQSSRNMTLKNYLKLIDPFCQSDRSLWQHHLVLFSMNRQHYNKVFLSDVKLPIFSKNRKCCGSETPDFEPVCQPQVPCFDIVHALLSRLPHRERTFCTRPFLIFMCN